MQAKAAVRLLSQDPDTKPQHGVRDAVNEIFYGSVAAGLSHRDAYAYDGSPA